MARPSKFTQTLADNICEQIANGESLRAICADAKMPGKKAVLAWLGKHESFRTQYAHAREAQADHFADEILVIADDGSNDTNTTEDGRTIVNHDCIQRSRLRVDTRKWLMARMAPKKYGDKLGVVHGGDADAPPIKHEHSALAVIRSRLAGIAARRQADGSAAEPDADPA